MLHDNQGVIKGLPEKNRKESLCLYGSQLPVHLQFYSSLMLQQEGETSSSASVGVPSRRGGSQTYSLVLLGGPERELAMDGYLDTCFFRGQEAANMAPPRTSRREPPQAMKMAAPNSNLGQTRWY